MLLLLTYLLEGVIMEATFFGDTKLRKIDDEIDFIYLVRINLVVDFLTSIV